ncbi:MAG: polyribonucleotide nucleotidyltransferase [Chloroflexi bacterium]|nr:polyribonucleotide nucleotidyltransferase [Chloroflexota bacterium]
MEREFTAGFGREPITISTGKLAQQAGGSVLMRWGDTVILVTATASSEPRHGIDFFPLTVDLEERRYAAGKIPGGFFKREGRPSTEAILTVRKVDRPLRPLFPDGYRNDVQIVITPLSADEEHSIDILSIVGASAALMISDIPFETPVGAVRVGYINGEYVLNPVNSEIAVSELDMALAGTADSVNMIEVGANELSEEIIAEAIRIGHEAMQSVIALQVEMRAAIGKEKKPGQRFGVPAEVADLARECVQARITELVSGELPREERHAAEDALRAELLTHASEELPAPQLAEAFEALMKKAMRDRIIATGKRIDGRGLDEIRELKAEVGLLPRVHGSALFSRGETQVLNIVTLGSADDEQRIEWLSEDGTRRYMHHYNFPPYSTGEAYPMRGPRRREIGHGALAEKAVQIVLPPAEEFPYTIRTVSEAVSSNGSTSMASTCASSLALFDAGVPLRAAVAGIAIGLITSDDNYALLTDIQGLEDHLGDMDFKVTGTAKGITAIQLDIKITGLAHHLIVEALAKAKVGRMQVLDVMNAALAAPRTDMSPFAPRITTVTIPVSKIGALIGPGGKNIRGIIDETGVSINVDDDGIVTVASNNGEAMAEAISRITALTAEPEVGRIYTGKVVRTTDFGAFVEFMPGHDGLVHISQLADFRVASVEDVAQVGDEITVMVTDVDANGRVRLSRQAVLEGWTAEEARERDRKPSGGGRSRDRDGGSRGRR